MKRIIVLGATGSIGVQALQVVAASNDLRVVGLSCHQNVALLLEQAVSLRVEEVAITDPSAAAKVPVCLYPELHVRSGPQAAAQLVAEVEADLVLNAIVGFAGLEASLAALERGRTLALANKESLVCAGTLLMDIAQRRGVRILPVDSEHSALFQLVAAAGPQAVEKVYLTASGGPFRGYDRERLRRVGRREALAHPTWQMGAKITVDSATLMNKGLEVIEAHHLFGLPFERIEVVVHRQSLVHGLVGLSDGMLLAHLGLPDMRVPIAYALHYPDRRGAGVPLPDLAQGLTLDFEPVDAEVFPAVDLARDAGRRGDRAACALNAANEVAVEAFLSGRLSFLGICEIVAHVLSQAEGGRVGTYHEAVAVDGWARKAATEAIAARGEAVRGEATSGETA
jgi:1-deoxy-D-xylulose-5-phosphate reductoisomerase